MKPLFGVAPRDAPRDWLNELVDIGVKRMARLPHQGMARQQSPNEVGAPKLHNLKVFYLRKSPYNASKTAIMLTKIFKESANSLKTTILKTYAKT